MQVILSIIIASITAYFLASRFFILVKKREKSFQTLYTQSRNGEAVIEGPVKKSYSHEAIKQINRSDAPTGVYDFHSPEDRSDIYDDTIANALEQYRNLMRKIHDIEKIIKILITKIHLNDSKLVEVRSDIDTLLLSYYDSIREARLYKQRVNYLDKKIEESIQNIIEKNDYERLDINQFRIISGSEDGVESLTENSIDETCLATVNGTNCNDPSRRNSYCSNHVRETPAANHEQWKGILDELKELNQNMLKELQVANCNIKKIIDSSDEVESLFQFSHQLVKQCRKKNNSLQKDHHFY